MVLRAVNIQPLHGIEQLGNSFPILAVLHVQKQV